MLFAAALTFAQQPTAHVVLREVEPKYIDLSSCQWTANDEPVKVPHSFSWLSPSGSVTNICRRGVCSYKATLPETNPNKTYHLQLDGASRCAKVFVNGTKVGIHRYGFLPSRFDITRRLVRGGTNSIEIVVYQNEKDAGLRPCIPISGDFHVFHGLYRKVWLVEDYKPTPLCKPVLTYKDGFFRDASGNKVFLRGVNYHQYFGYDWTYDEAKERRDLMLIKQMGANAIRTAHYPKSPRFYEMCDELGLYVFTEVPLVNQMWGQEEDVNLYAGYVETMIKEYGSHPCIIAWGLYNELSGNQHTNVIKKAQALAHRLDPSRPTYGANCNVQGFSSTPDILGINAYWNWYTWYMKEEFVTWMAKKAVEYKKPGSFFITEYGCGGNIDQKSSDKVPAEWMEKMIPVDGGLLKPENPSSNPFHPVDYQLHVHTRAWLSVKDCLSKPAYLRDPWEGYFADHCGGVFIWQMFDTPTPQRNEGSLKNINDKGLMTIDRKPKPAYEFYKKMWNQDR